jgi:hypothetical protein
MIVLAKSAARVPLRKDDKLERDFWLTKKKRAWINATPGRILLCFHSGVSAVHRGNILGAIGLDLSAHPTSDPVQLVSVPDFQKLIGLMKTLGPKLDGS